MNINELCLWTDPRRVETKRGPRMLRTAEATEEFWDAWREHKAELKKAGVGCGKNRKTGDWEVTWWQELAETDKQEMEANIEASRATDADIAIPCPDGLAYLPFQRAGIGYAMARARCLIADEMGLGKTVQAIGVINASPEIGRVLVVCPASLRLNWQRELEVWLYEPRSIGIVDGGAPAAFMAVEDCDVIICNYDVLKKHRKAIDRIGWDLMILDECQYLKNGKAARTKAVYGAKGEGGIEAKRTLALSGTPLVNRPIELWSLVEHLDPLGLGRSFFGFAKKYADAHRNAFGWDFSGASNLEQLQRLLRESCMVRRLKADVLTELPAKRRQVVELPINGAVRAVKAEQKAYAGHQAALEAAAVAVELAKAGSDEAYEDAVARLRSLQQVAFSEMSRVRHETALAKVPAVISHVEDSLEAGPVVLFAHHRDVVEQISEHFGDRCVTLTGGTKMEDRQQAVDDFQAGKVHLFIGNIQAAGTGITLVRSSHVIFAELDWVPGNVSQAEDRCHRIGQAASVNVQHLVLDGSLDAQMARTIVAKQRVIDAALDDAIDMEELKKPILFAGADIATREVPKSKFDEEAKSITAEQREAIHESLRRLSAMCDGASAQDGMGFNKLDTRIGKELAAMRALTPRQAALGRKIAWKYKGQLGELAEAMR
jgi:SNF2 family DNA or RNA helicase